MSEQMRDTPWYFNYFMAHSLVYLGVLCAFFFCHITSALYFILDPSKSAYIGPGQCVTHRIPGKNLVSGHFVAPESKYHDIGAYIISRTGSQPISLRRLSVGKTHFSFLTVDAHNEYDVCFRAVPKPRQPTPNEPVPPPPPADLEYKVGISLTYVPDTFGDQQALEAAAPVERDFIVSEQQLRQAADETSAYEKSERKLRDVNESTLERVTWLSIFSILSLMAIGVWQIYYLKGYFRTKKLI